MSTYKVITYEMKSGLFGTNFEKTDVELANYLNKMSEQGWELISIANVDNQSKNFTYKLIFCKNK